jgi:hypothetical protein
MKRSIFVFLSIFIVASFGCATIQRKFQRKKKKKEKEQVIVSLEDYSQFVNYDDLYKRHYLLWQYWHDELINSIGRSRKKQILCYTQTLDNLISLKKFITPDKKDILNKYCKDLSKIGKRIESKRSLNRIEAERIGRELEKLKRLIDKEFRYSKIKNYIVSPPKKEPCNGN